MAAAPQLTPDEAQVMITVAALSGGIFMLGDDLETLPTDRLALLRNPNVLGLVGGPAAEPVHLFSAPEREAHDHWFASRRSLPPLWVRRDPDGTTIAAVYNWNDAAKPYRLHFGEATGAGGTFTITDLWSTRRGGRALGVKTDTLRLTLPPHSVRLLKNETRRRPRAALTNCSQTIMRRVLFYRLYEGRPCPAGRAGERRARLHPQPRLAWRCLRGSQPRTPPTSSPWSNFRHARNEEGPSLTAAGFLRLLGDETDAIATLYFMNDVSQRFHGRALLDDEEKPDRKAPATSTYRQGPPAVRHADRRCARGAPVIKKMEGEPITFYPPTYRPNPYFRRDKPGMWGFSLRGIRDFAPSFLEAEAEAMRIYRGFRRLNP